MALLTRLAPLLQQAPRRADKSRKFLWWQAARTSYLFSITPAPVRIGSLLLLRDSSEASLTEPVPTTVDDTGPKKRGGVVSALRLESIKSRIIVLALLATSIPYAGMAWFTYAQNRTAITIAVSEELRTFSSQAAREADLWLKQRVYDLGVFATSSAVIENVRIATEVDNEAPEEARGLVQDYLESVEQRVRGYDGLRIVDVESLVVAATGTTEGLMLDPDLPEGWLDAFLEDRPALGEPRRGSNLPGDGISVGVPIRSAGGDLIGGLFATLNLQPMGTVLAVYSPGENGSVYVLPQTVGVAVMDQLPRGRGIRGPEFTIDGREPQEGQAVPQTLLLSVNHSYFGTMEIPLREGRVFESSDREGEPLVVVSRAFVGFHFPGESVLGRRITLEDASREIVGVVEDVFHTRAELPGALAGLAYLPLEQHPIRSVAYAVRTTGDPTAIAGDLRTAVWAVEPAAPVGDVGTLDAFIADEMSVIRVVGGMMGFFGLLALVLSAMGIYGVMAHAVAQRSREIGIRMALGAEGGTVVRLMLRNGLVQAGVGIVIGLPLALLIRRAAQGISVQFRADLGGPMVIVLVAGVLGAVCLLASYLPARRAAGVDPITALRTDG